MVLQDTGAAPPDSFSDHPHPSDNDPWSSSSPPSRSTLQTQFPYDSSKFPQPIPVLGPLIGYNASIVRWRVDDTLNYAQKALHRPLTPEEAWALAGHLYKAEQQRSYFTAAGLGLGIWRWSATRSKNSYPFYTPKPETVDPNKFWLLRGPYAAAARSAFRFGVWIGFAMMGCSVLGSMYTSPAAARAAAEDPNLQELRQTLQARVQQRQPPYGANPLGKDASTGPDGSLPPHAGAPRWSRTPPPPPRAPAQSGGDDDMSPTAGNDPWASSGDTDFYSSPDQPQQPQTPQQAFQQRKQRQRPATDYDASPTGGLFQEEAQANPNESAWERLRRGGSAAQSGEKSNLGDSWTFAESDAERTRAQEKAQREFDARIERERQGKDFNDEKRW